MDARHETGRPPEPIGRGVAPASPDRLREVLRQIELLRAQQDSPNTNQIEKNDPPRRSSRQAAREIDQLRTTRARPARDLSITSLVDMTHKRAADVQRRLGELIELWESLVPEEISRHTTLIALRGGVLHVAVDSSPIAFELDRHLREGLEMMLRQQYRHTLTRVKVTLAPVNTHHA